MKKTLLYFLLFHCFIITRSAYAALVIEQVNPSNIKFTEKTADELQKEGDGAKEAKNTEKTNSNQNMSEKNIAVPEKERTDIIINKQNKANINNVSIKQKEETEELLKEEKKNVRRTKIVKKRKKSKIDSDEENR